MNDSSTLTTGARRFRSRRRRFLLVATAALAAVGAAMGISFTADTGTSTVTVSAGTSGSLVYPVVAGTDKLPPDATGDAIVWGGATATSALAYATTAHSSGGHQVIDTPVFPSWNPVSGAAGSVTTPGDLFVIDGRTTSAGGASHITVNIYVTNLSALQSAYSSFAWPVDLYVQTPTPSAGSATIGGGTGNGVTAWHVVDATHPAANVNGGSNSAVNFTASNFFLTNTGGFLSYYLPTGVDIFYEFALDSGGSFYTVNSGGTISPQFFVTAQAT